MPSTATDYLKNYIRDIHDFPKAGIVFKDITPLLRDAKAFNETIDLMAQRFHNVHVDYIVGVESRGFIFGAPLAHQMGIGFIPVRKKGKLPSRTVDITYQLEYGEDSLEMHEDALKEGDRVLVIDDVLATGGTISAVANLLQQQKVDIVSLLFLMELSFLNGRDKLGSLPIQTLLAY